MISGKKKKSYRLISRWGKLARIYLGRIISCSEKYIAHDVYNAEKTLTPLNFREKISNSRGLGKKFSHKLNQPYPPPHKSQMVSHIGGGGRSGFDTIKKMTDAHSSCGGFPD